MNKPYNPLIRHSVLTEKDGWQMAVTRSANSLAWDQYDREAIEDLLNIGCEYITIGNLMYEVVPTNKGN